MGRPSASISRRRRESGASSRCCSSPVTTSANWPIGRSHRVPTSSGWQAATGRRPWSRQSRCSVTLPTFVSRRGPANHLALDLGLDRDDVVGALDAFTDGVERRIDLASLNERVFVNNASLGIYASVVQCDAYRDGKLGTWKRMLPEMLGRDAAASDLLFDAPHATDWPNASLVIVSNNPYQLRRFRGVGTRPRLDSGRLGIFATRMRGAGAVAKLVTLGTIGQHRRLGGLFDRDRPSDCTEQPFRPGREVANGSIACPRY